MRTDRRPFRFTRRRFAQLMGAALASVGVGRPASASVEPVYRVYRLDPIAVDPITGAGCRGCGACHRHAEHKRFASFEAADTRRAHPHCRCAIRSELVPGEVFVTLFGDPSSASFRATFDARWTGARDMVDTLPLGGLEMPVVGVR